MDENWDGMEKPLRQLLGMVKKNLSASERREVEDFISGNECDAAMEALVDILVEKREPLSKQALDLARKIATELDLGGELSRINNNLSGKA
ncbi:hypothetical protein LJC26_00465 [Desulfovibrio sp. OttesenSCG-928-O18]|nr:hypothetical protein [Desulfovibrio sp. OttesenSCG-928-O18]